MVYHQTPFIRLANKLLSTHKIRQILLFLEREVSQRAIAKEVKISRKTIAQYRVKILQTGINFSELLKRTDEQLEQVLGLIKPPATENTDPRKLHFDSLIDYFRLSSTASFTQNLNTRQRRLATTRNVQAALFIGISYSSSNIAKA